MSSIRMMTKLGFVVPTAQAVLSAPSRTPRMASVVESFRIVVVLGQIAAARSFLAVSMQSGAPFPLTFTLPLNLGNIQHPTSNAQHPIMTQTRGFGCSMFDVGCWVFSLFGSGIQGAKSPFRGILSPGDWVRVRGNRAPDRS